jgi:hypothetical protein
MPKKIYEIGTWRDYLKVSDFPYFRKCLWTTEKKKGKKKLFQKSEKIYLLKIVNILENVQSKLTFQIRIS